MGFGTLVKLGGGTIIARKFLHLLIMTELKEQYYITCVRNLLKMQNLFVLKQERALKQISQIEFTEELSNNADKYAIEMRLFDPEKDDIIIISEIVIQIDPKMQSFEITQLFGIMDISKYFPFKGSV